MCYTANLELLKRLQGQSHNATIVYLVLASMADSEGICRASRSTLSKYAKLSESSIQRAIKELKECGLMQCKQRRREIQGGMAGTQISNEYVLKQENVLHPWGLGVKKGGVRETAATGSQGTTPGSERPSTLVHSDPGAGSQGTTIEIHKGNIKEEVPPFIPPQRSKPKSSSRGSRLPAGWSPPQEGIDFALEKIGRDRAREELLKFRDYWSAQPGARGVKLNWLATWRNWVRKASERSQQPPRRQERIEWV